MKNFLRGKIGFTLVEALIAAFLLGICMVGVVKLFYDSIYFVAETREVAIASQAAKEEVELIRNMPYTAITGLSSTFTSPGFSYLNSAAGAVSVDNIYGASDIRRVSVTVTWNSIRGRAMSRSMATLVTRNGINRQ